MDRKTLREKIHFEIHIRNTMWTVFLLVATGTVSLIFRLDEGNIERIFFVIGIVLFFLFLNGCFKKEAFIEDLIKKFERSK